MDVVLLEKSFKGKASFQQVKKKESYSILKKYSKKKGKQKWEGRRYPCEMLTGPFGLTSGNGKGSFGNLLTVNNPDS